MTPGKVYRVNSYALEGSSFANQNLELVARHGWLWLCEVWNEPEEAGTLRIYRCHCVVVRQRSGGSRMKPGRIYRLKQDRVRTDVDGCLWLCLKENYSVGYLTGTLSHMRLFDMKSVASGLIMEAAPVTWFVKRPIG